MRGEDESFEEVFELFLEERPQDVEAFLERHRDHADQMRELLPVLQAMDEAGKFVASDEARELLLRSDDWKAKKERLIGGQTLAAPGSETREPGDGVPDTLVENVLAQVESGGARFCRYTPEGEVARGGQGSVLAVWDETLRRHLAMKVALASRVGSLGRFLEEAHVTAQLDHPGIVPVHDLGLDPERRVFFTMKLVKGRDLRTVFEMARTGEEGWTQTRVLGVLLKVCEAMAYAHAKGVIHRDLKPSNVMVGRYGEVYVMDWGLARILGRVDRKDVRIQSEPTEELRSLREQGDESDSPLVTMDGDVLGTPAYMSPEQAKGEMEAMGPHSDVYAVGAMLYQLLSGEVPYVPRGSRLSNRAVLALVKKGPPAPAHTRAREIPVELQAICEKAMARETTARYADMELLGGDLRAFLEDRVVSAHRTGAVVELRKWVRRNRGLAAGIAGSIFLAVGGLSGVGYVQAEGKKVADAERVNVMRLSALQDLDDLKKEADELWPPWPSHIREYEDWLRRARDVIAGLDPRPDGSDIGHGARLAELEARALPSTDGERLADRRSHPRFHELGRMKKELAVLRKAQAVREGLQEVEVVTLDTALQTGDGVGLTRVAWFLVKPDRLVYGQEAHGLAMARAAVSAEFPNGMERASAWDTLAWALHVNGLDDEALEAMGQAIAEAEGDPLFREQEANLLLAIEAAKSGSTLKNLEDEHANLEAVITRRHTWRFEHDADRWWHLQLVQLVDELEAFADSESGLVEGRISAEHGWSVQRRLAWARTVDELTTGSESTPSWPSAIEAIAVHPVYGGLEIEIQRGLVPLGPDPETELWEFAHLMTGEIPLRDDSGRLHIDEGTGLVFVLLPGGVFQMGAQAQAPEGRNYDPLAVAREGPVHEVFLSPFFLSKYEMTQGQWLRIAGDNPSVHRPETFTCSLLNPVEAVSWTSCDAILKRLGLTFPTEAQWEYGARGGTSSPWWTGPKMESLDGATNIADRSAVTSQFQLPNHESWLDDGYPSHSPVGVYRANPFGIHDVSGNVWEWCQDGFDRSYYAYGPDEDPCNDDWDPMGFRVIRGGCFKNMAEIARSACRFKMAPNGFMNNLGLRPARAITGEIRYVGEGK